MNKVKLKEICRLINGRAYKQNELLDTGKYPVLRVGNFFSDKGYYYSDMELDADKYCDNGDLLFAWSASFGPKIWSGGKVIYHYHIWKMELSEKVDKKYLYYYLFHLSERIKSEGHGGIMIHTTKAEMEEREFYLPDISEQMCIANLLSKVELLIEKRKQQLQQLDELVKARFVELFGDPETNTKNYKIVMLSEIAEYYNGLTYSPDNVSEEGTIVLRSSNIQNNQLDFSDTVRVDCTIKDKLFVRENDILMCSRNGSARLVGKVALIKNISEPMSFGAFMMIIRSKYYSYLMTYFQMDAFRRQIKTGATTTINQITGNMLNKISLPLPEMHEINEFADFVKQIDKSKFVVQKALDEAQTLFDSLMQEYFG